MSTPATMIGDIGRPVLHLDGQKLTAAFETLVGKSDDQGGVEMLIRGVRFKTEVFQNAFGSENLPNLDLDTFLGLAAFMAPVRRRVGPWLEENGSDSFENLRSAISDLLTEAAQTAEADAAIRRFCSKFPEGKKFRWVRDFAAELLHNVMPEYYPLMTRWVWDATANTGVLREIWFDDNIDHMTLDIGDDYQTFLVLREELSQFLSDNGVFRDVPHYVDMLCAQVYANYICEQGGSYLRTDFSAAEDPLQYTRRMLGMDGIDPETGRTRAKGVAGRPIIIDIDENTQ
jgi:hypothetical protein